MPFGGSGSPVRHSLLIVILRLVNLVLISQLENSIDSVSDRDHMVEFTAAAAMCFMHLTRLSEELILFSSQDFKFIELSDDFCTGSSIMPQKKEP